MTELSCQQVGERILLLVDLDRDPAEDSNLASHFEACQSCHSEWLELNQFESEIFRLKELESGRSQELKPTLVSSLDQITVLCNRSRRRHSWRKIVLGSATVSAAACFLVVLLLRILADSNPGPSSSKASLTAQLYFPQRSAQVLEQLPENEPYFLQLKAEEQGFAYVVHWNGKDLSWAFPFKDSGKSLSYLGYENQFLKFGESRIIPNPLDFDGFTREADLLGTGRNEWYFSFVCTDQIDEGELETRVQKFRPSLVDPIDFSLAVKEIEKKIIKNIGNCKILELHFGESRK